MRSARLCTVRMQTPRCIALPETRERSSWQRISRLRRMISIGSPTPRTCPGSASRSSGPKHPPRPGWPIVFAPSAAGAQLEASKAFAKNVMAAAGVPTAVSHTFTDLKAALACVDQHPEPLVVKASGLAGGKGAVVCSSRKEARSGVRAMLEAGEFGSAGRTVVIETFLEGEEISVFALTNGHDIELLPVAQDHKRLLEGDQGPNTGGMGAYSPVALGTPDLIERVKREVLEPTLEQMRRQKTPFTGVLYAGLMIDSSGAPWVVEFNCRLGDPEAQAVLPLVDSGLTDAFLNVAQGRAPTRLSASRGSAVTTVLASRGYPDASEKGAPIRLPDQQPSGVTIFHAGTTRGSDGLPRLAGGRVLTATGVAPTFEETQRPSRQAAEAVQFEGKIFRRDIGWRETLRLHERSAATVR